MIRRGLALAVCMLVLVACGLAVWIPSRAEAQSPGQGSDQGAAAVPQGSAEEPGAPPGSPAEPVPQGAQPGNPQQGGQPGATAGVPGSPAPGDPGQPPPPGQAGGQWNLSDLLDGLTAMEASLPLSAEQAARIRPVLERVLAATRAMARSETQIRSVLTPDQIHYIEELRRRGELRLDAGLGAPSHPGEDPVVTRVVKILKDRAAER